MDIREPKHTHTSDRHLRVDRKAEYKTPVLLKMGLSEELTQGDSNGPNYDNITLSTGVDS